MNALAKIADDSKLSTTDTQVLLATFSPLYDAADKFFTEAQAINVTDPTQVAEIKQARAKRLEGRQIRINAENARKVAKDGALRYGKAVDAIAGKVKEWCEQGETRLEDMEKIAERMEAERVLKLGKERVAALRQYNADIMDDAYNVNHFGRMPVAVFDMQLRAERERVEAAIAAQEKAEADAMAREIAEAEERERMRAENARLAAEAAKARKEREEAEAASRREREALEAAHRKQMQEEAAERAKVEAEARRVREAAEQKARDEAAIAAKKLAEERAAREKLEREAAERAAAEKKRLADEAKAARKAAAAPDRQKISCYAQALLAVPMPNVASDEAKAVIEDVSRRLEALVMSIEACSQAL